MTQLTIRLNPDKRLEICNYLFGLNSDQIKAGELEWGKIISQGVGKITRQPKECSGVWGYEGDSIAIWINEQPYPSYAIIQLNQELLPECYSTLLKQIND